MTGVQSVALVGLGLMGGSIARALRGRSDPPRLVAWTASGEEPAAALSAGILDAAPTTMADAVAGADLVVIATPVGAALGLLPAILEAAGPTAVVTDVCSVKAPLIDAARARGFERFVGAHPMTGSERSGWAAARADLYRDALVYLTPAPPGPSGIVERWWRDIGARTQRIEARAHDALMARVSHVPQILASALGAAIGEAGIPPDALGPGGHDMTRLAASDPDLWADLLLHSPDVRAGLRAVRDRLDRIDESLAVGDAGALRTLLADARRWKTRT